MDVATFWHIIEAAKAESKGNCEQHAQVLEQYLTQLSPEEIQSFHRLLWQFMNESYEDQLWAAAYLMNGGCSDDGFDYFRGWLIAQGESVFHAALRDPDTLAGVIEAMEPPPDDVYECEMLIYVGWHAYEARAGQEMPQEERPATDLAGESGEAGASSEEEDPWEDGDLKEEYARKHFPKLWAKFGW